MIEKKISSLEELTNEVNELNKLIQSSKGHEYQVLATLLFRGQSNAEWNLDTTLERYTDKKFSVFTYDGVLESIYPATASLTGKEWPVDFRGFNQSNDFFSSPPNYSFMVYARHHGFPTPLLDWSQSLYVALFFAFQNADPQKDVAIFSYIEYLGGGKAGWVGAPQISAIGPYVASHKRHFIQQGQYTVCVKHDKSNNWIYCPHSEVLATSNDSTSDILYKFIMPGEIKNEILQRLNEMNINAYSLYASEEGLMESLAFKELVLRNH
ncbi:FRG domain-containing protein [uncultured Microbulbifer sp.]|uniref:FRG domain-containing protein n=1 Tax=uncultured Microbulbifer sp. TaxID=348147 RepID=UPI002607E94E|nr:FRG domain-containing protein [uncultured Microbulbifer sp.]